MKKIIPNITFESVLAKIPNIEERNQVFNKMNMQSKRLEIAWDCLQLIISGKIVGSLGWYWDDDLFNIRRSCTNAKQFQHRLLNINEPKCEVCARGGMMLSQIRLGNLLHPNTKYIPQGDEAIIKGFTIQDFRNMEGEYERNKYNHPYENNTTEKLANICCNILVNGNFRARDKTNYLIIEE